MAVGTLALLYTVFLPITTTAVAYAGHRARYVDWRAALTRFLTGPGRTSRILLLFFLVLNWKSLPLAWTVRIFHSFAYHGLRRPKQLPQRALFQYSITSSRTSLLETDYNVHKSNSTYFADVDISRSHLVSRLLGPGIHIVARNATHKRVRDKQGNLVAGTFGIGLGAVFCSFRREMAPLQGYDMWSRILAWDRKWLYIVTHFVAKRGGKVTRGRRAQQQEEGEEDWTKRVIATAVSKYVFKLDRFTVHPTLVIDASGLLPERPSGGEEEGWRGGETDTGTATPEDLGDVDELDEWDWRRVELERRRGMEYAENFAALDGTHALFDGGEEGALGRFPLG